MNNQGQNLSPEELAEPRNWQFDANVTNEFESMLQRSIPDYEVMRSLVVQLAASFAENEPKRILDLGCSRGESIAKLLEILPKDVSYYLIDSSEPMIDVCRKRFTNCDRVNVELMDLRQNFPKGENSVVISCLTLQFIPVEYRLQVLRNVANSLARGNAFILVEKTLASTADVDDILTKVYYNLKAQNGYSDYEIQRKRLSLEGVLVPWSSFQNETSLQRAGFTQIECVWRWGQFAAWLAIR